MAIRKKLIEVALPLDAINAVAARIPNARAASYDPCRARKVGGSAMAVPIHSAAASISRSPTCA